MTSALDQSKNRVVEASFVAGAVEATGLPPPTLLEVAFAGRSNVGKSSDGRSRERAVPRGVLANSTFSRCAAPTV
jgi:hypothetical protein